LSVACGFAKEQQIFGRMTMVDVKAEFREQKMSTPKDGKNSMSV